MRISDWSSDVCSSDRGNVGLRARLREVGGLGDDGLHVLVDLLQLRLVHHVALGHDAAQALDGVTLLAHLLHLLLGAVLGGVGHGRSEEHTYELQSLMRISYAGCGLTKKKENKEPRRM